MLFEDEKKIVEEAIIFCKNGHCYRDPLNIFNDLFSLKNKHCILLALIADRHFDGHHNINYINKIRYLYETDIGLEVSKDFEWGCKNFDCIEYGFKDKPLDSLYILIRQMDLPHFIYEERGLHNESTRFGL